MPQHIVDLYRSGLTNFTATETNSSSLQINGTPRSGVFLAASHQGVTGGTSAVQTMHATGSPSSGSYTITVGGQVTALIPYNTGVAGILQAINNLRNVVLNNVLYPTVPLGAVTSTTVAATGYAAGDVALNFGGAWAFQPITPTIQAGTSNVNTPSVTSTTPGVGVTCAITAQGNDDNSATWVAIPGFGTLYVPASASLPGMELLHTPFKYVSFTATFGGSGTNLKNLQIGLRPYQGGVN